MAAKASAGAVSHVPVADVVNIARAIEELKQQNVWVVGLAGEAPQSYESIDWTAPSAIVLGAEGSGMRRLVRESCDFLVSIPMSGHVDSLNVSVAAGVVLFEAARQRRQPPYVLTLLPQPSQRGTQRSRHLPALGRVDVGELPLERDRVLAQTPDLGLLGRDPLVIPRRGRQNACPVPDAAQQAPQTSS